MWLIIYYTLYAILHTWSTQNVNRSEAKKFCHVIAPWVNHVGISGALQALWFLVPQAISGKYSSWKICPQWAPPIQCEKTTTKCVCNLWSSKISKEGREGHEVGVGILALFFMVETYTSRSKRSTEFPQHLLS